MFAQPVIQDNSHLSNQNTESNFNLTHKLLDTTYLEYLIIKSAPQIREETLVQIEECLRYMYLSHFVRGNIPVSKAVDEIWHLLILETKAYSALCKKLPRNNFMHHQSAVYEKLGNPDRLPPDPAKEAKRNLEWLVSYVANFGNFKQEVIEYWPYAKAIMEKLNLDLDSFNQKLRSYFSQN